MASRSKFSPTATNTSSAPDAPTDPDDAAPAAAPEDTPETSHRDRVKAKRKLAIETAALQLFASQGYDDTTIAQVAAAAGVSTRTVPMYFSSKAALFTDREEAGSVRLLEMLQQREPDADIFGIFEGWLRTEVKLDDPAVRTLRVAALTTNPTLRAFNSPSREAVTQYAAALVADLMGCSPDHPAVAIVLSGCSGVMEQFSTLVENFDADQVQKFVSIFMRSSADAVAAQLAEEKSTKNFNPSH